MQVKLNKFLQSEYFFLLIILLVSVAIMLPVYFKGIPFGYDLPHHYQCAITFVESIQNGDWYPSWSENRNFGFGGMESRLYPPISHYSLALFYLVFRDWHFASFFAFTFYTFIGGLGVYLWAKEYLPAKQAVFAGAIYILLPYHLNQLYNTFFYAEYVGSCVLPFSFLFLSRVCRRGKTMDLIGLIIAYAVLILTHLPLTVIGSICLAIYGLTLLKREKLFSQIIKLGISVFGGLAASSFFWTKVLLERDLMAKTLIYEDPWLDYRLHFLLTPIQTFEGELRERIYETATFYYDLMFLYAVILALACTIPFFFLEKRSKFSMKGIWLLFGTSVFLILPFSKFIWDALPFLQEVQFPWRWVAVVCIFASILAASQINFLIDWFKDSKFRPYALIICGAILAVVAFSTSQIVRQAPHIERETTEEMMAKNAKDIGFTFWWTIWTKKGIFDNKEKVTAQNRQVQIDNWEPTNREFQISEGNSVQARIATFYHPNWKATVNGGDVETKPDENGAILIPLSEKKSDIKLTFIEPQAVQMGRIISLGVWLSLLFFGLSQSLKSIRLTSSKNRKSSDFWDLLAKIYNFPNRRRKVFLLIPAALISLSPMIFFGVFEGGDLPQHIQIAGTFQNSIADGNFYPSWGGFENNGYGSNSVRFYPPVVAFLLGLLKFLTGNWMIANFLVFLFFTFIGGLGVYLWAKEYLPSQKAIWAGIFFILMPYHLFEIHNASMYAEFAGMSVVPFSFLFLTRICKSGDWKNVISLAASFGLLVLTHLPTTVIGSLSLFIFALLILPRNRIFLTLFKLALSVSLGLCASSVYWSRMLFERNWMRLTKFWGTDHFSYNANFLFSSLEIDERQLWFFSLIAISLIFSASLSIFAIYHKRRKSDRPKLFGLIFIFSLAILMTTFVSQPLWSIFPTLQEIQFPWRWMTIASISGSVLIAIGIESLQRLAKESKSLEKTVKVFSITTICIFAVIYGIIWIGFQQKYVPNTSYDTWSSENAAGMGQEWFWTPLIKPEIFKVSEKIVANGRKIIIQKWNPEERIFTVDAGEPTNLRIATIYYPYWKATINDKQTEIRASDDGVILLAVGEEKTVVKLWFEEPSKPQSAYILSIISWMFILSYLTFNKALKIFQKNPPIT